MMKLRIESIMHMHPINLLFIWSQHEAIYLSRQQYLFCSSQYMRKCTSKNVAKFCKEENNEKLPWYDTFADGQQFNHQLNLISKLMLS